MVVVKLLSMLWGVGCINMGMVVCLVILVILVGLVSIVMVLCVIVLLMWWVLWVVELVRVVNRLLGDMFWVCSVILVIVWFLVMVC